MPGISRRSFLIGAGAAGALAACGGDDGNSAATTTSPPTTANGAADAFVLGASFDPNRLLVAGIPQRAPFLLYEPTGGLADVADVPPELTFEFEAADGEAPAPVVVATHGADIARPYWPVTTTFPSAGLVTVRVEVAGSMLDQTVTVQEPGSLAVPQIGDPLPSAPTPTVADPLGVETICTQDPPCPLHEVSLADALAEGRPVALLVSTPAYCQVAICGPVLELLVDAAPSHPDLAIIHVEVYPNGEPTAESLSPVVAETLGLTYEPVLFAADASGTVTARLDNIYDGDELAQALASAG